MSSRDWEGLVYSTFECNRLAADDQAPVRTKTLRREIFPDAES